MLSFGYVVFFCINDIPGLIGGNFAPLFGPKSNKRIENSRSEKEFVTIF